MNPAFYTPLRYPGGKGKLAEFLKRVLRENKLLDCIYAEPYAGGAGIAMELMLQGYVSEIYINDVDPAVWAFWHSVLNKTDALCQMIENTPVDLKSWRAQREVLSRKDLRSPLRLGFAAFFLNRTNRSGILTAGVIGGKNQDGQWKIDARFNKPELMRRIRAIADWKAQIHLSRLDAIEFLRSEVARFSKPSLVYLDPPYYNKGGDLYEHHYKHDDHVKVALEVRRLRVSHWLVSYDNVEPVRDLYRGLTTLQYSLSYTAANRYRGTEAIFFGPGLQVPDLCAPMRAA